MISSWCAGVPASMTLDQADKVQAMGQAMSEAEIMERILPKRGMTGEKSALMKQLRYKAVEQETL
jgi:hypothetical protein